MVIGAFPIAKLSVLLIKQISKPIANICKERAKNHPVFRSYVCMPPAQFYNWCEVKAKMWILNLGKPVNIPVLSQEMAIELGANLLGESVIFVIGATLLIFEYNRQSNKEAAKEAKREQEMKHVSNTIIDLYFTVQQQQTQLKEMERIIHTIGENKSNGSPPFPTAPSGPSPPPPPTASPQNISHPNVRHFESEPTTPTPYPNKGIILQSLNYIQMDVLSSIFPNSSALRNNEVMEETQASTVKREPAFVTAALYNIENNFRSLF